MDLGTQTSNPFALLLDFYHRYRRSALQPDSLSKVVKKYSKAANRNSLLGDVIKKYPDYSIESNISMAYLNKLIVQYNVPEIYYKLIENYHFDSMSTTFDEAKDPCSEKFDVMLVLNNKSIILPNAIVSKIGYDNLSKCRNLVPGMQAKHAIITFAEHPSNCKCTACVALTAESAASNVSESHPFLDDIMNLSMKCKELFVKFYCIYYF